MSNDVGVSVSELGEAGGCSISLTPSLKKRRVFFTLIFVFD
jgi:hypothetical protein